MNRAQARRQNGRWTRNTLRNTFGLDVVICKNCGAMHPYESRNPVEIKLHDECRDCGSELPLEEGEGE